MSRGFAASVGSTSLPRPVRVTLPACKTDCHRTTTNQGQSINQSGLEWFGIAEQRQDSEPGERHGEGIVQKTADGEMREHARVYI